MPEDARDRAESIATTAVHGYERERDNPEGAVVPPVFHSSTYGFASFAEMREFALGDMTDRFFYSRYANPTVAESQPERKPIVG